MISGSLFAPLCESPNDLYNASFLIWGARDCDGNDDAVVSVTDLLVLLGQYDALAPINCTGGTCDFNGGGCVDIVDC